MAKSPTNNVVEVKPAPTVYTVLILIALIFLIAAIFIAGNRLTAAPADGSGYGLSVGDILKPWEEIQPKADTGLYGGARRPARGSR
ncbi:MAG: hypothetical protein JXA11_02020 [Phycisphaerae bacterium]|nr:hypothetical protein [Phycisphaerae bacterium]